MVEKRKKRGSHWFNNVAMYLSIYTLFQKLKGFIDKKKRNTKDGVKADRVIKIVFICQTKIFKYNFTIKLYESNIQ